MKPQPPQDITVTNPPGMFVHVSRQDTIPWYECSDEHTEIDSTMENTGQRCITRFPDKACPCGAYRVHWSL